MADTSSWDNEHFWDGLFQVGETPWDLGKPSPTLVALEMELGLPPETKVIVPGAGFGNDALHFARQYEVSVVDWSEQAIQEIRMRAKKGDIPIEALKSDFFEIPAAWHGTFDLWVEHTFYCAIDPVDRRRYVDQSTKLLSPKGELIGVFFINNQVKSGSSIFTERPGPPFWASEEEVRTLFEPHFEILKFEPSRYAEGGRAKMEWLGHFKRKS